MISPSIGIFIVFVGIYMLRVFALLLLLSSTWFSYQDKLSSASIEPDILIQLIADISIDTDDNNPDSVTQNSRFGVELNPQQEIYFAPSINAFVNQLTTAIIRAPPSLES